jgi:hypothetical protein
MDNNITSNVDLKLFLEILNITNVIIRSKDNFNTYPKNGNYIVNLADSDNSGTHWTALFIKNDIAVYFDSYGLAPPNQVKLFCKSKKLIYNTDTIQSFDSTACGYYCILFIYHFNRLNKTYITARQYGYALNKFNSVFNINNTEKNDGILKKQLNLIYRNNI